MLAPWTHHNIRKHAASCLLRASPSTNFISVEQRVFAYEWKGHEASQPKWSYSPIATARSLRSRRSPFTKHLRLNCARPIRICPYNGLHWLPLQENGVAIGTVIRGFQYTNRAVLISDLIQKNSQRFGEALPGLCTGNHCIQLF